LPHFGCTTPADLFPSHVLPGLGDRQRPECPSWLPGCPGDLHRPELRLPNQRPEVPAVADGLPWWPPPGRGARSWLPGCLVASTGPRCPPWLMGCPGGLHRPELRLPCRPGGLHRPEEQPTRRVLPTPHLTSSVRKPTHPTRYGK